MKIIAIAVAATCLMSQVAFAAKLSCDDLKAKIAKKVEGKGVKNYTLTLVAKDAKEDGRVVGTCEGDSKKLIYRKGK